MPIRRLIQFFSTPSREHEGFAHPEQPSKSSLNSVHGPAGDKIGAPSKRFRLLRRSCGISLFLAMVMTIVPEPTQATPPTSSEKPLEIVVTILPQVDLVKRLGGEQVQVHCLLGPGQSHGVYEPRPRDLAILSRCSLFLGIGIPFEKHLVVKVKNAVPGLNFLNLAEGLSLRATEGSHDHSEHGSAAHVCGEQDPHIWLGPTQLQALAKKTLAVLITSRPQHQEAFQARADEFLTELAALHQRLRQLLEPFRGRAIMVFHPAYGYFLDEFGLRQVPIEFEGKEPGPRELTRLIRLARQERVGTLFSQPQFSGRALQTVADALHANVVMVDPMPTEILPLLESLGNSLAEALKKEQ